MHVNPGFINGLVLCVTHKFTFLKWEIQKREIGCREIRSEGSAPYPRDRSATRVQPRSHGRGSAHAGPVFLYRAHHWRRG